MILVDLMGGDHAPQSVIDGVRLFLHDDPTARVGLIGHPDVLAGPRHDMPAGRVELIPATEIIENEDQPALAVRRKRDSSIVVGMRRVAEGAADVFVSCGSTGALMTAGLFAFGRLPGVRRPALGGVFPNLARPDGNPWFMLDIGANVDATPDDLRSYAVIGSVYAALVMEIPNPRVGLLNVGVEEHKGSETYRKAYGLLGATTLNFAGNIEARELFSSPADVVVCDGFVGNILLKGLEGLVGGLAAGMRHELQGSFRGKIGGALAKPCLRRALGRLDYTAHGGAPLFGLAGPCIKCHGSSNAGAVRSGLRVARDFVASGALAAMSTALGEQAGAP
ncbi:MAG: phosphate acyltransferase PlsX [Bacillota bacterium]|nr:phosphate acyltransferase PlsX [Bacillota bacterium]